MLDDIVVMKCVNRSKAMDTNSKSYMNWAKRSECLSEKRMITKDGRGVC